VAQNSMSLQKMQLQWEVPSRQPTRLPAQPLSALSLIERAVIARASVAIFNRARTFRCIQAQTMRASSGFDGLASGSLQRGAYEAPGFAA